VLSFIIKGSGLPAPLLHCMFSGFWGSHGLCCFQALSYPLSSGIPYTTLFPATGIKSYGNIKDCTLKEIVNKDIFKDVWYINKDKIAVCQNCEFRYICTDCRAYIDDPQNIYSKPLKCGYDPYTCKWEDWSTNPLKYNSISFYNLNEM